VINTLRPLKTIYLRVYAFNSLIPSGKSSRHPWRCCIGREQPCSTLKNL